MKFGSSLLFFVLLTNWALAQRVTGIVQDSTTNETIEFVNIQDLKTFGGTISNEEGGFEINVQLPTTLRFSFLGYNSKDIAINEQNIKDVFRIQLAPQTLEFKEIVLEGEKLNMGKDIVQKLIQKKKNRVKYDRYSSDVYRQTKMTKFTPASEKDSIPNDTITVEYLNEVASTQYRDGAKYKKIVKAEIKSTGDSQLKRFAPMVSGSGFRGSNRFVEYNPIEYFTTPSDFDIDIYDNALNNQSLSDRPITSPLATTAMANYTYRLKKMDFVGVDTVFTIAVRPRFKEAPLWGGQLVVSSANGYRLDMAQLTLDPDLNGVSGFELQLIYTDVEGQQVPTDKRLHYKAKMGRFEYDVKSTYRTSNYNLQPEYSKNFFSSEQVRYEESALKPNSDLMLEYRGIALEKDLKIFFNEQDSIYRSITSDEYLEEQDSIFNSITWRKVLLEGFGKRTRAKGMTYTFNSLLESFAIFGVDGFRINPGGSVRKEFANSNQVDVFYNLSYGIDNQNLKGRGSLGYTFYPQKFARVYAGGGDVFDIITVNQSLDAIISRSNFISHKFLNVGYSMELANGLYFNSKVEYSDKESVSSLATNEISAFLFGDQDTALDFERYKIFTVDMDFTYRFGQKYMTRGRKKIVLPDNNPSVKLSYRKGMPGILNSEVNFDYFELELAQKLPAIKLGSFNWKARVGGFANKASLRILEYNYFRGSTRYIFTNPLNDLVQLGKTRSTPNAFFQAAAIHHFNGFFLDKVPLINKLQMEMLGGAGSLVIPDQGLYHLELYLGVGKKVKIWGETVQFAVYAVTADSSLSNPVIEYKLGVNFYNAFAREWIY